MFIITYFKKQSKEYEMSFWKLPDFLMLASGLLNVIMMIITYWWAVDFMNDPRETVFVIALESLAVLFISNIMVESSKKIMDGGLLKREFINIISHQIRTPLTNIKWSVEAIKNNQEKNKKSNSEVEELTDQISASAERIMDLLSDFFYLSKIEEEKIKDGRFNTENFEVNKMIEEIIKSNIYLAKTRKIKIDFRVKNKVKLTSDSSRVKLILDNLIDNAIKYSVPNNKVEINIDKNKKYFLFNVVSYGCEIREKDRKYIFTKFFRSNNAKKMNSSGTGLGLYICKNLTDKLGGKIWFVSDVKKTVFFLKLPLGEV